VHKASESSCLLKYGEPSHPTPAESAAPSGPSTGHFTKLCKGLWFKILCAQFSGDICGPLKGTGAPCGEERTSDPTLQEHFSVLVALTVSPRVQWCDK
jgi:hypothetical protein